MKTPCRFPGCRALLDKTGYCDAHQHHAKKSGKDYDKRRRSDSRLGMAASIRDSARWKRIAKIKRSMNPMCEDPFGDHQRRGATASVDQVHHIKGIVAHPDLAYDMDNLMSVCTACHAKLEAAERNGQRLRDSLE